MLIFSFLLLFPGRQIYYFFSFLLSVWKSPALAAAAAAKAGEASSDSFFPRRKSQWTFFFLPRGNWSTFFLQHFSCKFFLSLSFAKEKCVCVLLRKGKADTSLKTPFFSWCTGWAIPKFVVNCSDGEASTETPDLFLLFFFHPLHFWLGHPVPRPRGRPTLSEEGEVIWTLSLSHRHTQKQEATKEEQKKILTHSLPLFSLLPPTIILFSSLRRTSLCHKRKRERERDRPSPFVFVSHFFFLDTPFSLFLYSLRVYLHVLRPLARPEQTKPRVEMREISYVHVDVEK